MNDSEPDKTWEFDPLAKSYDQVVATGEGVHLNYEQVLAAVVKRAALFPGCRVLDIGTGTGNLAQLCAQQGAEVEGVDRTERYLKRARNAAEQEGLDIEFIKADMREFCRPDAFDMVINMFTSFGYFENPDDDVRVVENVSKSLRDGGCFAIESMGKEILARIYLPNNWDEGEDGTLFLERRQVERDWGWMNNQWIIINGTERFEVDFSQRIFSAVELKTLLLDHGFKTAEAYGGMDGSAYDQKAKRMLVLGRK